MSWLIGLSTLWLAVVVLLIARALRQRGRLETLLPASVGYPDCAPSIAVVVPARDESANIEPCLKSLLMQTYPKDRMSVVVVDDGSVDGTGEIVQRMMESERRLSLLRSPSLPPGWTGKSHACWIAGRTVPPDVEWLCFIDADMRAEPELLASAVSGAMAEDLALLSLAPRHTLKSFAERLIIPCGLCFLGFRQDLRGARPEHPDVVATGQFFLADRNTYESAGGHAAVRSEICEDLELARLFKARGARVCMKDANSLLSTRMYTGWSMLWPGFAKNLTELLGGTGAAIGVALVSVVLAWAAVALPVADALVCRGGDHAACAALVPAGLASAAMVALHVACAVHLGIPPLYGLLFPAGYTVGAFMVFDSVRWRVRRRVNWKGRNYLLPRPGRL
ncbi:MAG TPA: glycosyltransferase family A protein [Rhizomicrobium sp.]|jgi:chlorobactene glucosyltransferase